MELEQETIVRKRAEEALKRSEESYRYLIESANDIIFKTDANGHFTFFNPVAVKKTGYPEQELKGKHYLDLIRDDYREDTNRFYNSQYAKKIPTTYYEFPMITKDGKEVWVGQHVQLMVEGDRISGFHAVALEDIGDSPDRQLDDTADREGAAAGCVDR